MDKKRLAINMAAQLLAFAVNMGISFFLAPIIEAQMANTYGFVTLANQFVLYAQIVVSALNTMASRFVTIHIHRGEEQEAREYFSSVFFGNVIMAGIFLLPALIAIGLVVSFYSVFSKKTGPQNLSYAVVERPGGTDGDTAQNKLTILYDIPEINVRIKDEAGTPQDVSLRLNIELTRMEDVQIVEGLMPKIVDAVIAHTIELTPDEISGSNGLYWLREELLYRINLIVSPVVVANLNFKAFGIDK